MNIDDIFYGVIAIIFIGLLFKAVYWLKKIYNRVRQIAKILENVYVNRHAKNPV